jgi:hypothetical protein
MTNSSAKIFISAAVGLIVTVALFFFVFRPLLSDVKKLNKSLTDKHAESQELKDQIVEYKSAQSDLARATYKDDIFNTIVDKEDLSLAITDLEAAAVSTGVKESIQIRELEEGGSRRAAALKKSATLFDGLILTNEVEYTMNVNGGFAEVVRFMQALENLPHFTEYSTVTLSTSAETLPQGGSRNSGDLTGTLEGVFLIRQPSATKTTANENTSK